MATAARPIRRVVTGNDINGRSKIVWDGPAPNVHSNLGDRYYTDLWVWNESPAPLSGEHDDGNLDYGFPGPDHGGHLRVVQWPQCPAEYDAASDPHIVPEHAPKIRPPGRTLDRGGNNFFSSAIHKTTTVDYGIMMAGERVLVIDGHELPMHPGDVVIQVGAWHQWTFRRMQGLMAFDMITAHFVDGDGGLGQGSAVPMASATQYLPPGVKPTRRIVVVDRGPGQSSLVCDGPSPDVRIDPARPGYATTRLWVTDSTPANIVFETLHLPHTLEPPARGSVCRVVTFPPDECWRKNTSAADVRAFFVAMGSPDASTSSAQAPHPYMQKTASLDFCIVIEGFITLVLDTQEVNLKAGDVVVQRGTNHAWSNRSGLPAVVQITSHDGCHVPRLK
jgi:uncharacterized cupin superfamily protein